MRARLLKPGYFDNEQLGALPLGAHFLFSGLWCMADREGRLKDNPRAILGAIFASRREVDEPSVDAWLAVLDQAGFIRRYSVDGARCIEICTFSKHQQVHQREAASTIPPPDKGLTLGAPLADLRQAKGSTEAEAEAEAVSEAAPEAADERSAQKPQQCTPASLLLPLAEAKAMNGRTGRTRNEPPMSSQEAGALGQVEQMLRQWQQVVHVNWGPVNVELCRRLLQIHGNDLDSLFGALKRLRDRPISGRCWGWLITVMSKVAVDNPDRNCIRAG
jgi:hypothetical protein